MVAFQLLLLFWNGSLLHGKANLFYIKLVIVWKNKHSHLLYVTLQMVIPLCDCGILPCRQIDEMSHYFRSQTLFVSLTWMQIQQRFFTTSYQILCKLTLLIVLFSVSQPTLSPYGNNKWLSSLPCTHSLVRASHLKVTQCLCFLQLDYLCFKLGMLNHWHKLSHSCNFRVCRRIRM